MSNRNITIVLCLVLFLGLFFQYNRTDGFIRLIKNTNVSAAVGPVKQRAEPDENIPREKYLLVYDAGNVYSLLLKRSVEKTVQYMKKEVQSVPAQAAIGLGPDYAGVLLAVENLDNVKNLGVIREYVRQGGKAYLLIRPMPGPALSSLYREIGFTNVGGVVDTSGVRMYSNLLIGGKGLELNDNNLTTSTLKGEVDAKARVHMTSGEGIPMLWEYGYGKGEYIVYNGSGFDDKTNRGLLVSVLGLGKDTYVYPVLGIKVVFIDDFPAPFPDGTDDRLYKDYHLPTAEFFRRVWWPDMLKAAERYGVKYTGVMIETYDDKVKPPFRDEKPDPIAHNNLIIFGRELLKNGGEMGLHGYNHQPLAPKGYNQEKLGYAVWENDDAMALSVAEAIRYEQEAYPDYKIKVYVPPSNILSPEGRHALVKTMPDLKVISSLYIGGPEESSAFIQEFGRGPDGVLDMPRISSDYSRDASTDWSILNGLNFPGAFIHFVHPDDIFFAENADRRWKDMYNEFDSLLKDVYEKHGWLRSVTASQGAEHLEDILNLDYRVVEKGDNLTIACWGFRDDVYFTLRTAKKVREYQGCTVQNIGENAYLLKISSPLATVRFESEVKQ